MSGPTFAKRWVTLVAQIGADNSIFGYRIRAIALLPRGRSTMAETNYADADDIGVTAGHVWQFLHDHGSASLNKLTTQLGLSRELALQAIGWLAREDKLVFEKANRARLMKLK